MSTAYVVAFAVLLSACAANAPVPEDRFYHLQLAAPAPVASALSGALEVDYTHADPLRSGRAVVYSDSRAPLQLKRYHYAFWADQPPRLVHRALMEYLREAGTAERVVAPGQGARAGYRLESRLLKFEQLRNGTAVAVEAALQVSVQRLPAGPALWTRTYTRREAAAGDDLHASAQAMQVALAGVFQALNRDLLQLAGK